MEPAAAKSAPATPAKGKGRVDALAATPVASSSSSPSISSSKASREATPVQPKPATPVNSRKRFADDDDEVAREAEATIKSVEKATIQKSAEKATIQKSAEKATIPKSAEKATKETRRTDSRSEEANDDDDDEAPQVVTKSAAKAEAQARTAVQLQSLAAYVSFC